VSVEKLIADRITGSGGDKGNISGPIVKIGIIGIAVGVAVMLITISVVLGFKKEIVEKITGLTTHIVASNVNVNAGNEPEPVRLTDDTLAMLERLPFVKHVQQTAFKNGLLKTATENEGIVLKGVGPEYDFSFLTTHLKSGNLPVFRHDEVSKDILISDALVNKLGLKLGERIQVYFISQHEVYDSIANDYITRSEQRSRRFTVCGIFKTDFADFDDKLGIVDIRQLRKLSYWDSTMAGNIEIHLKDFTRIDSDIEQLQELLGYGYNVSSVKELYNNIFIWLEKLDINGVIIIVLMIIVATMNMITALLILILERTNMVGLVKALGMSNFNVRKIFMLISLKLIGKGLLWGNIAGIALCLLQYYTHLATLDSSTYYVDHVVVHINWWYFILLDIGTLAVCGLMLILPTFIVTRLTPVRTLKFD
jgi:lipoprotein-releasing system permease protein